ncbi:hypothetical protein T492DRAFT_832435 [Pavlovales sp. CCMP2436]|nr:hypothetical protein T492DRAFT_832435 [Pavlovales sp. CCMP2436]
MHCPLMTCVPFALCPTTCSELNHNRLIGTIPTEMGQFKKMEILILEANQLWKSATPSGLPTELAFLYNPPNNDKALISAALTPALSAALTFGAGAAVNGDFGALAAITFGRGAVHGPDSLSTEAITGALKTANEDGPWPAGSVSSVDIFSSVVLPGAYNIGTAVIVPAGLDITIDGEGDPNATFIFIVKAATTFGAGVSFLPVNGAKAGNVFWKVGGALTAGAGANVVGTFLVNGAGTLGAGATLEGRLFSQAAVTLGAGAVINNIP